MAASPSLPPTRLFLIRHGETLWNREGRWQGHADPDLSDRGHAEAEQLALRLAEAHAQKPWQAVFASDLLRARRTADRIAEALRLPLELDARLRELDVGTWSGRTRADIVATEPELLAAFESGRPGIRPGGGESRIEIRERSHAFVRSLLARHAGCRLLVVTHLGVIRALVPGARPENLACTEVEAEALAARGIDRDQRAGEGPL